MTAWIFFALSVALLLAAAATQLLGRPRAAYVLYVACAWCFADGFAFLARPWISFACMPFIAGFGVGCGLEQGKRWWPRSPSDESET